MQRSSRAEPSDAIPESATPVGGGAGGLGLDPGDPDEDPDRRQLLDSQRGEIREANSRLPEPQREALALRELEELSYDEIAVIMEMNRNSVAQLISRARLNLRTELRGAALESIAVAGPDCERALPLITRRDDGELGDAADVAWLESHLGSCGGCRLRVEAMQEAGASYRAWAPIAVAPWLFEETMAKAAELAGADWSETIAARGASRPDPAALPGMPAAYLREARSGGGSSARRWAVVAAALLALLLGGLLTAGGIDDRDGDTEPPVVESRPAEAPAAVPSAGEPPAGKQSSGSTEPESPPQASGEAPPSAEGSAGGAPPVAEPARSGGGDGAGDAPQDRVGQERRPRPGGGSGAPAAEPGGGAAGEAQLPPPPPPAEPEPPSGEPEPPPRDPRPPTAPGGGFKAAPPPGPIPQ